VPGVLGIGMLMLPLVVPVVYAQLVKLVSNIPAGTTAIQSSAVGLPMPAQVTVTEAPGATCAGLLVRLGGFTENGAPLLVSPLTVTTTLPVVARPGTRTVMLLADQLVDVAGVPLMVTVLVPFVAPKFAPLIVTGAPTCALDGDSPVTLGGISTV